MTIDDAEWHTDSVFDLGLDRSAAAVHIGVFLAWAGSRGLLAPQHEAGVNAIRARRMTPAEYAQTRFVAQFGRWDLTEPGHAFVDFGYGAYLDFAGTGYTLADDWTTYDELARVLDDLYLRWREIPDVNG